MITIDPKLLPVITPDEKVELDYTLSLVSPYGNFDSVTYMDNAVLTLLAHLPRVVPLEMASNCTDAALKQFNDRLPMPVTEYRPRTLKQYVGTQHETVHEYITRMDTIDPSDIIGTCLSLTRTTATIAFNTPICNPVAVTKGLGRPDFRTGTVKLDTILKVLVKF